MTALQQMESQWFPVYYPMGPRSFLDGDGQPTGAANSIAELTKDVPNWPILFQGLRITNVYALPNQPSELDIRTFEASKRYLDDEQTVRIDISQQNITAEPTLQVQLTGKSGVYWAPFPIPFPMAGGNNVTIRIQRVTAYPQLNQTQIQPVVFATILASQARNRDQTMPTRRILAAQ